MLLRERKVVLRNRSMQDQRLHLVPSLRELLLSYLHDLERFLGKLGEREEDRGEGR
jgi:hypothetical protein